MNRLNVSPFGVASRRGRRSSQEDAHFTLSLDGGQVLGLFDGHNGYRAAKMAAEMAREHFEWEKEREPRGIIKQLFANIHDYLRRETSGTTAVVTHIQPKGILTCGWVGDSRCMVIGRGGLRQITTDHRVNNETEQSRIIKIGGPSCIIPPYIYEPNGNGLMMTRALGDHSFESVGVIAEPQFKAYRMRLGDRFCLLVCDGVWEFISDEQLAQLAKGRRSPQHLAELIADMAYCNGSTDNITVVICKL